MRLNYPRCQYRVCRSKWISDNCWCNYQWNQQLWGGACIRALLYKERDTMETEGEPVENHEIAQTRSVRKITYLMQYPHLKVRHTSYWMVTTEHSYWVTSQYSNATDIDIHHPIAINKTLQSRVYTLFFTDTLCWTLHVARLPSELHSVYCSFIFSLDLTVHRVLNIWTLKITKLRHVEKSGTDCLWRSVTSQKNWICKHSVFQTRTLRRLIPTKIIQTCIQFDILYTGCSMDDFSF